MRLLRARELLIETDLPLTQIAERAGFQHSEYLSVVFKQRLGQTPGRYRAAHTSAQAAPSNRTKSVDRKALETK
jgi:LacI family transcriptional regulator